MKGPRYFSECFPYLTVLHLGIVKSAFLRLYLLFVISILLWKPRPRVHSSFSRRLNLPSVVNMSLLTTRWTAVGEPFNHRSRVCFEPWIFRTVEDGMKQLATYL